MVLPVIICLILVIPLVTVQVGKAAQAIKGPVCIDHIAGYAIPRLVGHLIARKDSNLYQGLLSIISAGEVI